MLASAGEVEAAEFGLAAEFIFGAHGGGRSRADGVGCCPYGGALAFSPVLWSRTVIAEAYALRALFAALLEFFAIGAANVSVEFCELGV
jgi:hypothetical protein